MDPTLTVHETLAAGSPLHMVPMIRNILGGFLFWGDDVYKKVRVLSGGERTRLAVARMLLRPSNTLLLDEPTNHLDLDSKEVLLDALVDYGGTLIFVSHDRYFVERLATKIIEIGNGTAIVYPGTYQEFLWHKEHADEPGLLAPTLTNKSARADATPAVRPKQLREAKRQPRAASRPSPSHPAKSANAPTRRRGRNLAPNRPSAPKSRRSKRKLPRPKMPSAISSSGWPPPGSMTTARLPSPSSTSTRP